MATPLSVFKKGKNGIFTRIKNGATGLKIVMHTKLNSGSNLGVGFTWPHLFLLVCKVKMPKKCYFKNTLIQVAVSINPYIFVISFARGTCQECL